MGIRSRQANNVDKGSVTAGKQGSYTGPREPPPQPAGSAGLLYYATRASLLVGALGAVAALGGYISLTPWQLLDDGSSAGSRPERPFVLAPLSAPLVTESSLFDATYRERMLWGTYRSSLYCGIRTREPAGLLAGLMWAEPSVQGSQQARHKAQQGDDLETYGWRQHDMRTYGHQVIIDHGLRVETSFLKSPGPGYGGDWSLRVNVTHEPGTARASSKRRLTLSFYMHDEALAGPASRNKLLPTRAALNMEDLASPAGAEVAAGHSSTLGDWQLRAAARFPKSASSSRALLAHANLAHAEAHTLEGAVLQRVYQRYVAMDPRPPVADFDFLMPSTTDADADTSLLQVQAQVPFTVDYAFTSASLPVDIAGDAPRPARNGADRSGRFVALSGPQLSGKLAAAADAFDKRFAGLARTGDRDQGSGSGAPAPDATLATAQAALSNTLGSMGYFYGSSQVQMPPPAAHAARGGARAAQAGTAGELAQSAARPLFTAVPSRSFFPRGFLWDEGFHQLLVQQWDLRASCDVLAHWLDLMNQDGWIPREQILGAEARDRVPAEFVAQLPAAANPPTLFLPLMELAAAIAAAPEGAAGAVPPLLARSAAQGDPVSRADLEDFLRRAWPRLSAWWRWFDRLQRGPSTGSYRWRGRLEGSDRELNPKTLASGLDDYPRASHPSSEERHLDLLCWMAFASQAMTDIGNALKVDATEVEFFRSRAASLRALPNLRQHHWASKDGMFLDWGSHTEDLKLTRRRVRGAFTADGQPEYVTKRTATGRAPTPQHVPHFGYVSLFPLALKLLPPGAPELGSTLQLLRRPDLLWTPFGLRSLAQSSSLYAARNTADDPPYWRGAIWINVNFLVVRALRHYAEIAGPYQQQAGELYEGLMENVLGNVVSQYSAGRRSFLWENYNDTTGAGAGSHPFTGWTALSALLALRRF